MYRIIVVIVMISLIRGDICDVCTCTRNVCDSTKYSFCFNNVEEFFTCNGGDGIDLNSIQWPNRNITVSMKFNDFKLTYLTK